MSEEEIKYFDGIAKGYEYLNTAETPVRRCVEIYTLLNLIGSCKNKTIFEPACSDGYFSRILMKAGAGSILAMDISQKMIDLARAEEIRRPLGIDYKVADIFTLQGEAAFDVVFSPFIMSYAKDRDELLKLCKILFRQLNSGGRLVSMNDHPEILADSVTGYEKYGKTKRAIGPLRDGSELEVVWLEIDENGREDSFSFRCHYFSRDAFIWALSKAGFVDIRFHEPQVSPQGLEEYGEAFWEKFLANPLLIFIEARKPGIIQETSLRHRH